MKNVLCIALVLCSFLVSTTMNAQTAERPWAVGLHVGNSQYSGDYGSSFLDFKPFQGFAGLSVGRHLSDAFDVEIRGQKGRHGHWEDDNITNSFLVDQWHFNAAAHYKFLGTKNFKPYLKAGLGYSSYSAVDGRGADDSDFSVPLGIGFDLGLTDALSLNYQSVYGLNFGDDYDANITEDNNDNFIHHSLGLKLNFGGSSDRDGDGVVDSKDMCPDVPGLKALKGCPDTDGDGVADNEDGCPLVPGTGLNGGCPEIEVIHLDVMREALYGVFFDNAKSTIKPASFDVLDRVVYVMQENEYYNLSIEGHTDSDGEASFNQKLSEDRARAVRNYLTSKGIDRTRLTAKGFGETMPIASNDTEDGQAKNRRVEFKLSY